MTELKAFKAYGTFKEHGYEWVQRNEGVALLRLDGRVERWRLAETADMGGRVLRTAALLYVFAEDVTFLEELPTLGRLDLKPGQPIELVEQGGRGVIVDSYWAPGAMRYRVLVRDTGRVRGLSPWAVRWVPGELEPVSFSPEAPTRAVRALKPRKEPKPKKPSVFALYGYRYLRGDGGPDGYAYFLNEAGQIERWKYETDKPLRERVMRGNTKWWWYVETMPDWFELPAKPERA